MSDAEVFGRTHNGEPVMRVELTGGGLTAHVLTWGAVLQNLRLEGHDRPLVCGFADFEPYPAHSPHFGAIPGRVANRIGNARFMLDGKTCELEANKGPHMLHGGANGYGRRVWNIADLGTSHVDLTLTDTDGTAGFPGTVEATCSYTLKAGGVLHIALTTRTDAPTITNLTHHSYFDLEGKGDIRDHFLQVHAETRLPVDAEFIPTGAPVPVAGTGRDFCQLRPISDALAQLEREGDGVLDHNYCLSENRQGLRDVARVVSPDARLEMTVATTEPGLQIYAGHKIATPVAGLAGMPYGAYAGLCLEPQIWPDAINQEGYPTAILRPHELRRQVTTYRFTRNG